MTKETYKKTAKHWLKVTAYNVLAFLGGRKVSVDFFLRHKFSVGLIIVMLVSYMGSKYLYLEDIEEMRKLSQKLEIAETKCVQVKTLYMNQIRESEMTRRVDSMKLNLKVQENPPFYVTY